MLCSWQLIKKGDAERTGRPSPHIAAAALWPDPVPPRPLPSHMNVDHPTSKVPENFAVVRFGRKSMTNVQKKSHFLAGRVKQRTDFFRFFY